MYILSSTHTHTRTHTWIHNLYVYICTHTHVHTHTHRHVHARDNVPVFLYLLNGDHFSRPSVSKRSNRRRFGFGMTHTIKCNMPNWTPKNPLIVLKLRPIPPSAQGVSFTIWQLCHCLSTGCATVLLPPGDRINRQAKRRGMMGRNWVCFRTFIWEFNWILRFKIRVRAFYHPQPPQDANF